MIKDQPISISEPIDHYEITLKNVSMKSLNGFGFFVDASKDGRLDTDIEATPCDDIYMDVTVKNVKLKGLTGVGTYKEIEEV